MIKYKVISDSMIPLIPVGAEILITPVKDASILKRFDILVFKVEDKLICHYLWHVNKVFDQGKIVTRNLKDGGCDIPFEFNKVHGRVTNFRLSGWHKFKIALGDYLK